MASFKILKGISEKIPTELHEGYAYFTTDEGNLYIDISDTERVQVNAKSAKTLSGLTATISELNILDGVTATATEINKLDGLTATTAQLNKTAKLSTVATSGSYTDLSNKPAIPTVYTAAQCTTYTSDSGTVTPLAVQNAAKKFAIPRITSTANAIARYSNTTGEVKNSTIKIEDVINTRDGSEAEVISIPAANGTKKMVYGYCTDQTDGTSFVGGLFEADATEFPYSSGLAIGGSSGNLLWKGSRVAVATDIPTKVSQLTNDSGYKTTDNNTTYSLSKSGSTITLTGSDGSTTSVTDSNTTYNLSSFGVTATAAELNYVDGVTSNIQTQLNNKANSSTVSSHTSNTSNPHSVTATQVGAYTKVEVDNKISNIKVDVTSDVPMHFGINASGGLTITYDDGT